MDTGWNTVQLEWRQKKKEYVEWIMKNIMNTTKH